MKYTVGNLILESLNGVPEVLTIVLNDLSDYYGDPGFGGYRVDLTASEESYFLEDIPSIEADDNMIYGVSDGR